LVRQEVAVEYKDFVDEILEESPEAIQMTTDTSLAIGRDPNAKIGGYHPMKEVGCGLCLVESSLDSMHGY
jgi:hypothetical protein